MLPCCGHFIIANEALDEVTISGCENGIDWSVIHKDNMVILELEDEFDRDGYVAFWNEWHRRREML